MMYISTALVPSVQQQTCQGFCGETYVQEAFSFIDGNKTVIEKETQQSRSKENGETSY